MRYLLDLSLTISFPADVAIRECIFAANPFNYAIIFKNSDFTSLDILVSNCTFSSNKGAVSLSFSDNGFLVIDDSDFLNNWSLEPGGAVSGESANIFVHGSNFINNTSGASGGAIHFFLSSAEISDCLFKNNLASIEGGAISTSVADSLYSCIQLFFPR